MRNKSLHQLFLTLLILSFPFVTATATNYYETMEVGETRDFTGFTPQPDRTGYVGIVDYTWSLDTGGDKILTIKPDVYVSCTVKAIAEGTACLTFQANSTIIGVGGSYPLLKNYFITVKKGTIKVTSVSITPSSVSLNVGDTKQLSKTILPNNATDQTTTWSSSNTSVASVSSSGLVTANATGNATITCKANDGSGKQATCVISVSKAKPVPVDWISLSYSSISLIVGNARQLSATVSPSNATDKTLAWTSSNSSVASVSSSGLVTAKSAGSATITCKANDGSGKYATCNVTVTNPDVVVAEINATNFPDASFRSWLLSQTYGTDGKLTENEIKNITSIYVSGSSSSPGTIRSLKGIEYFTSLKYLYCAYNQLTSLDVSRLTALTSLSCGNNQLTSLDVSRLTALTYLSCSSNQLTSLDVSNLTALTSLSCSDNQLTSLDVSKLTALTYLSCSSNQLTSLDVSRLTALTDLSCGNNQLTSLDVSRLTALTSLYCYNNQLKSLDVSKLTALETLYCFNNQLTSLDVSRLTALTSLYCHNNQLTTLDVSRLTALETLYCYNNHLTSLDVSKLTALTSLYCYKNELTSLDVSRLTALTSLSCYNNQLTSLDVSKLTALTSLSCYDNQLTTLNVSNLTALTYLSCSDNQLTSLDVSRLTALTDLSCSNNQLTSLDVSRLTALTYLSCGNNHLTSLDVSNLTALPSLSCSSNQLTSLDVSKLTALTSLNCGNNQLTSLDVSNLTALTSLYCYNNQLTSLDVSKLTALTSMNCGNNQLTALDVSKLTVLQDLYCYNNQLSALDVSKNKSLKLLCCYNNGFKGTAMDNLISSLPKNNTGEVYRFRVVGEDLSNESNVCTTTQVAAVKAKGWFPCYYDSTTKEYVEYEGSDGSVPVTSISLNIASVTLKAGETKQLSKIITPSNASNQNVTWSSSNTSVASVSSNGLVTAIAAGSATITCKANDGSGKFATCSVIVSSTDIEINATNFPDASFRSWLLSQTYGTDGKLTESEINSITSINVSGSYIKSLKGIEYFTSLTWLACENNQLTSLDVSNLTALRWLDCMVNQLTSLDVSRLTTLKYLYCDNNQLISLDVSKSIGLVDLVCSNNQLTSLDVSKNTSLTWLRCNNNKLKTLNISKNTALTILYCEHNQLTTLDVSKNTALCFLSCNNNSIKGTAMDYLISSLPKNNTGEVHRFSVVGEDLANEGNVCTTTQAAAVKATGWFPCYYDSTTKEYVEYEGSDDTPTIKGDVNGDGQVNGTDLVALTNIILGKSSKTDAADVNGDGYVNGTDYVALANIVLGRSNAKATAKAKGAIQAAVTTGLSIEPFDIKAGESKEMVIDLTNPNDEITLVQFDLRLPAGLSVKQTGGEYDIDIAGRTTWRKHSLDANATNGIVRFLLASSSNATLTGTEGAVIKITIAADNSFTGGDIQLENILMVTPAEKEIKQDTYTYQVGQSQPSPASTGLAVEPFSISAGGEAEMVIDLNNPDDEITLVQFDLRLPNGLSVKQSGGEYDFDIAGRTTWRKHSLDANATNGIVRFLLASSSNATLTGTEGAVIKITLKADNSFAGGAVKLENILLVTPAEKEIKQSNVSYVIGTTGIKSVVIDNIEKNTPIYNLSGQRLDKPRKGINIIGGKKVMVK